MSPASVLSPILEHALDRLEVRAAGEVDLRRDLYLFTDFVRREGLKRSHRGNAIPKGPALKLAKILSWAREAEAVKEDGTGYWSDAVSRLARELGLVAFDIEGTYVGYSSTEPSFPDNVIKFDQKAFAKWLAAEPLSKERAILDKLIETRGSEFFRHATLFSNEDRFDTFGSAVGPASRMHLPSIRWALLEMLAGMPAGVWLPTAGLIDHLQATAPTLILDPALRQHPVSDYDRSLLKRGQKIQQRLDERYQNFLEYSGGNRYQGKPEQLTERSPDVFRRVEGRYLQYFLQEIPFLCGFVDLALAPERSAGEKTWPRLESVRAFRLTPRLAQVVRGDPTIQRVSVTVLANFDVLIEAPSWPDREIDALAPCCVRLKEDGPTQLFGIDRKKVVDFVATRSEPTPSIRETLEKLSTKPLPANVAAELDAWSGHAQKFTVFENVALVELRGPEPGRIRDELGDVVIDNRPQGFVITRNADRTVAVLEQRLRVPRVVSHAAHRFASCDGPLGTLSVDPKHPAAKKRESVRLAVEDMVGYQSDSVDLIDALQEALARAGCPCDRIVGEKRLFIRASDVPKVRSTLKKLEDRFDVKLTR